MPPPANRRRRVAGFSVVGVLVLLFGGCTVQSLRDPCFFDPPPGEQWSRTITNDSATAVALVYCDDDACRKGYNETRLSADQATDVIVEACGETTFAVEDPTTHSVLGCLHEVGDLLGKPDSASQRRVTERHPCAGSNGLPYVIRIYDPSK